MLISQLTSTNSYKQTFKQSLPWLAFSAVAITVAIYATQAFRNQTPLQCISGSSQEVIDYYAPRIAQTNQAFDKFCLAKAYESRESEEAMEQARALYVEAAKQGLFEAIEIVCKSSIWRNGMTNVKELEVREICCPSPNFLEKLGLYQFCCDCIGPIQLARMKAGTAG